MLGMDIQEAYLCIETYIASRSVDLASHSDSPKRDTFVLHPCMSAAAFNDIAIAGKYVWPSASHIILVAT